MNKLLGIGLSAVMVMGMTIGGYQAMAASSETDAKDSPKVEISDNDVLGKTVEGTTTYSVDGKNWIGQAEYDRLHGGSDTEWWTYDEYAKWIDEQKLTLEALIGTGDGWYDGKNNFHEWTQETVDEQIANYKKILEDIKAGVRYSKDLDNGDSLSQIPPTDDVVCEYGADVVKDDGEKVNMGIFSSNENLQQALEKAVAAGTLTQKEADAVMNSNK